jgi:adhesin/invasin
VITSFAGPVTLTDTTGTLTVASVVWTNGVGVATVSVGAASTRDRITAVSGSVSVVTGVFNVLGPVACLGVAVSPATTVSQNTAVTVTVTAVDSAGQVVTGYSGPVTLTDTSGAMQVLDPGNWLAGVNTESVSFSKTITRDRVTVGDGSGHSGQSAVFAVTAPIINNGTVGGLAS